MHVPVRSPAMAEASSTPLPKQVTSPENRSLPEKPTVAANAVENSSQEPRQTSKAAKPLNIAPTDEAPHSLDEAPPLPDEPIPEAQDDGWEPVWDQTHGAYYFFNKYTKVTQWDNPRVPVETQKSKGTGAAGGYNPAIHGDYDPNADYAHKEEEQPGGLFDSTLEAVKNGYNPHDASSYGSAAQFNRFTGRFQNNTVHASHDPNHHTDDAKSGRQMNAFFDVDAAANSHDGRSLKAERQNQKLTKEQVKAYNEKRRSKKEAKRRAWLMD